VAIKLRKWQKEIRGHVKVIKYLHIKVKLQLVLKKPGYLWTGQPRGQCASPGSQEFSFSRAIWIGPGAQPPSYTMGTRG
jgi:hypothetical protein